MPFIGQMFPCVYVVKDNYNYDINPYHPGVIWDQAQNRGNDLFCKDSYGNLKYQQDNKSRNNNKQIIAV